MSQYHLILALLAVCVHAETKYCRCFPDQWQGLLIISANLCDKDKSEFIQPYTQMIYYDYINKRDAAFTNATERGKPYSVLVLNLYHEKVQYMLDLVSGECPKREIQSNMTKACILDSATPVGKPFYYGAGSQKLKAQRYMLHKTSYMNVEEDLCTPISRVEYYRGSMQTIEWTNMETRIVNPDVFKVPKECQQAVVGPVKESPDIIPQSPTNLSKMDQPGSSSGPTVS